MHKLILSLAAAATLGAMTMLPGAAQAAPGGLSRQLSAAAVDLSMVEDAQYIFGGRNYCFYLDGWRGPGWYWCGYAYRRGYGWGGPRGWHGWSYRSSSRYYYRGGSHYRGGGHYHGGSRTGGRHGSGGRQGHGGGRQGHGGGRQGHGGGGGHGGHGGGHHR